MPVPLKGYGALRHGRHSAPGSDYFLTICLRRPSRSLLDADLQTRCLAEMRGLEREELWTVRCAMVMPDHLHLLLTLGTGSALSDAVRLFKGRLSPVLRQHDTSWQPSFYDHRLRDDEDRLPVFLYIFLNPYRAELLPANQTWPGLLLRRIELGVVWPAHERILPGAGLAKVKRVGDKPRPTTEQPDDRPGIHQGVNRRSLQWSKGLSRPDFTMPATRRVHSPKDGPLCATLRLAVGRPLRDTGFGACGESVGILARFARSHRGQASPSEGVQENLSF